MPQHLPVYLSDYFLLTPLANGRSVVFDRVCEGMSAIHSVHHPAWSDTTWPLSCFEESYIQHLQQTHQVSTRFDACLLEAVQQFRLQSTLPWYDNRTGLILSTTKGNVSLLEDQPHSPDLLLTASAKRIATLLGWQSRPHIISNACISGLSALIMARRLLAEGHYRNILVVGADVVSRFILSGFQSFHAMSSQRCKPFDAKRDGINLGEAVAAVWLSTEEKAPVEVLPGFISNDANHLSGPSKTGEELAWCIRQSLKVAGVDAREISFINAHGTATLYNDEMEANAFTHAGVSERPVFSLKGHFGHTLGACGVLETALCAEALIQERMPPNIGYTSHGVSKPLQVVQQVNSFHGEFALKTGSGFGGCNAALMLQKKQVGA